MVLADDLRSSVTNLALYPAGTVISERILEKVKQLPVQGRVLVYDPDSLVEKVVQEHSSQQDKEKEQEVAEAPAADSTTHSAAGQDEKGEKEQDSINLRPEKISQQALKIYNSTFKTVREFYQSASLTGDINVKKAKHAAGDIAAEIVRDPQVLLQISVLKAIDNYTFSHAIHVAIYATTLARVLGFAAQELNKISLAGLLHDIGKVDVPTEILNKPARLSPDEYKIMQEHVRYSFKRVCSFGDLDSNILYAISQHHEKVDGSGYLQKLKGEEIHRWARILAIADVYDAVTSRRVYKEASLPHEGAEILMGSVGHLDQDLLKVFLRYISVYPVGCEVILNTGETGKVVATNPNLPTRPFVQLQGKDKKGTRVINLSSSLTIFITGIIKE